ncbi:hypothetical protein NDU88_004045 [Pleurodeles waltl]|uniref:Reverse transcriptase domain-containing protein n=1 Tax=Pleurodeles waltl TaxID=8319 RepID=A0AAV7L0A4_PLEWA|nr:hypothetical protein NDU88_004045 [Pleurodeles waltl]
MQSWDYLWEVLHRIGIGPYFLSWVRLLYTALWERVRTGAIVSDSFDIERGTRQGYPLSPLLFALAMEPLAIHLRAGLQRWGIRVGTRKHIASHHADDALVYVTDPERSIPLLLHMMDDFGGISGLRLVIDYYTAITVLSGHTLCIVALRKKMRIVDLAWTRHHIWKGRTRCGADEV